MQSSLPETLPLKPLAPFTSSSSCSTDILSRKGMTFRVVGYIEATLVNKGLPLLPGGETIAFGDILVYRRADKISG